MKNLFKTFALLFIQLFICITYVAASNIDMNLESNTIFNETNTLEENVNENNLSEDEALNTEVNNTVDDDTNNSSPRITSTTVDTDEDEFLTVENILSMIIIVIGILLVFLAVAILIRFK